MDKASPKQRWFIAHLLLENGFAVKIEIPQSYNELKTLAVDVLTLSKNDASKLIEMLLKKDWDKVNAILEKEGILKTNN